MFFQNEGVLKRILKNIGIDQFSQESDKHTRLRIESWCKKLCQVTNNYEWRKNRNLHAICLLDMILNNRFEEPYNKFPGDGPIPLLSKPIVKSKLSKKFWLYSQYLESQNLINSEDELSSSDNYNNNVNEIEENDNNLNYMNDNMNINKNNYKVNYRRPKTSEIKVKNKNMNRIRINNNENRITNKKRNKYGINKNEIDEINELNDIIYNLQCEINRQDFIINNQINEKKKLQKRIYELEQVLKNFC